MIAIKNRQCARRRRRRSGGFLSSRYFFLSDRRLLNKSNYLIQSTITVWLNVPFTGFGEAEEEEDEQHESLVGRNSGERLYFMLCYNLKQWRSANSTIASGCLLLPSACPGQRLILLCPSHHCLAYHRLSVYQLSRTHRMRMNGNGLLDLVDYAACAPS